MAEVVSFEVANATDRFVVTLGAEVKVTGVDERSAELIAGHVTRMLRFDRSPADGSPARAAADSVANLVRGRVMKITEPFMLDGTIY